MDTVAGAVLNLIVSSESPSVVNVVHPRPVSWTKVFNTISNTLGSHIPLVSYHDWLAKLEDAAQNPSPSQLEEIVRSSILLPRAPLLMCL